MKNQNEWMDRHNHISTLHLEHVKFVKTTTNLDRLGYLINFAAGYLRDLSLKVVFNSDCESSVSEP